MCLKAPVEIIGKPQPATPNQPATPGTALECQHYRKQTTHPIKPRPLFIFRTQIKIFLIKSESFLTLHRQQHNYHVQGPER